MSQNPERSWWHAISAICCHKNIPSAFQLLTAGHRCRAVQPARLQAASDSADEQVNWGTYVNDSMPLFSRYLYFLPIAEFTVGTSFTKRSDLPMSNILSSPRFPCTVDIQTRGEPPAKEESLTCGKYVRQFRRWKDKQHFQHRFFLQLIIISIQLDVFPM